MAYLDTKFINFNVYFPPKCDASVLQLPLVHTTRDTVDNFITAMAILIHSVSNQIELLKLDLKRFTTVF